MNRFVILTHLPLVPHICVSESDAHWLKYSAQSLYLNQYRKIISSYPGDKLQWNLKRHSCITIQEKTFENIVRKMATILFRPE